MAVLGLCLMGLTACASPCERVDSDLRNLTAAMIRDPAMLADGRYDRGFRELAARKVEHGCFGD
jgi:hypothetical protein